MSIKIYNAAGERLSHLDMSDHLARIDEATAERGKIGAVLERGMADIGALGKRINEAKFGPTVDADQAADALLSGGDVAIEVDTIEQLELERTALNVGMTRLRERETEAGRIETEAKNAAHQSLGACVADLAPALLAEAQQAAERLAAVFAAAVALAEGAGSTEARGVADRLRPALAEAQIAQLLPSNQIPVPVDMLDLLKAGRKPIEQLGRRWPDRVAVPERPINLALVAMGTENRLLREKIASLRAA